MLRDEWDLAEVAVDAEAEDNGPLYKVSGCGVSLICPKSSVMSWVNFIVARGGVPEVSKL